MNSLESEGVQQFLRDYADCLDQDRLEEWPEFFAEDGCYLVLSRENLALALPAPIIYHYSKGMLIDRVTAIRDALTYEPVYTRHIISNATVKQSAPGGCTARSNYSIYQTTLEGRTRLFGVGEYQDEIVLSANGPRFAKRTVIVDTFAIHNLLAVPL